MNAKVSSRTFADEDESQPLEEKKKGGGEEKKGAKDMSLPPSPIPPQPTATEGVAG